MCYVIFISFLSHIVHIQSPIFLNYVIFPSKFFSFSFILSFDRISSVMLGAEFYPSNMEDSILLTYIVFLVFCLGQAVDYLLISLLKNSSIFIIFCNFLYTEWKILRHDLFEIRNKIYIDVKYSKKDNDCKVYKCFRPNRWEFFTYISLFQCFCFLCFIAFMFFFMDIFNVCWHMTYTKYSNLNYKTWWICISYPC